LKRDKQTSPEKFETSGGTLNISNSLVLPDDPSHNLLLLESTLSKNKALTKMPDAKIQKASLRVQSD